MLPAMRRLALVVVVGLLACKKPSREEEGQRPELRTPQPARPTVTLRIAYGSEKKAWLEEAAKQFEAANPSIKIETKPTGSGEAAAAILDGSFKAHVYSPASTAYLAIINQQ